MIAEFSPTAVAATAVINLGLAVIAGRIAARLWLSLSNGAAFSPQKSRSVAITWLAIAAGALVLLFDQAAQLSETTIFAAWDSAVMLASQTFSGQATASIVVLALVASALCWWRPGLLMVMICWFAIVTAIRATMGHAGENGPLSLPVLVEWAHLVAMSLWVGCVIISGWVVLPALSTARGSEAAVRNYTARLSTWATVALAVIILSGVFNTDRVLTSYSDLLYTSYGNLLLAKIVLVLVALGLGGLNRIKGIPALQSDPIDNGRRQFTTILKIESLVLTAVVLVAAVLTNVSAHG